VLVDCLWYGVLHDFTGGLHTQECFSRGAGRCEAPSVSYDVDTRLVEGALHELQSDRIFDRQRDKEVEIWYVIGWNPRLVDESDDI
jgi:hypothetical protein